VTSRWHLYIVECSDGSLYTGITTDVVRRVNEHNGSPRGARYTRTRRPVALRAVAYVGESMSIALRVERKFKRLRTKRKLEVIAEGELATFIQAARHPVPHRNASTFWRHLPARFEVFTRAGETTFEPARGDYRVHQWTTDVDRIFQVPGSKRRRRFKARSICGLYIAARPFFRVPKGCETCEVCARGISTS
jgi:putative endonuclease